MPLAAAAAVLCFYAGAHEVAYGAFTSVECLPQSVQAGQNVTCEVTTVALAAETDLSLLPTGVASEISLLSAEPHKYRVAFATGRAGVAGVRVQHTVFFTRSEVDVRPAAAVSAIPSCSPSQVVMSQRVTCELIPRDQFGNSAEVRRPPGAPNNFFSVMPVGSASEVVVGDTTVSFVASAPGRAGLAVTLDGT